MKANHNTADKEKRKNALYLIALTIIVLALVIATIVVTIEKKDVSASDIKASDLESFKIYYPTEVANQFKLGYRTYLKSWLQDDIKEYIDAIDIDKVGASAVLIALCEAGISADKVAAIARYLNQHTNHNEFFENAASGIITPILDENGDPMYDEDGNLMIETPTTIQAFSGLLYAIDIPGIIESLIYETGITAFEFGKFFYELTLISIDPTAEEYALLVDMGRADFSYMFLNVANLYRALSETSQATNLTYADGRMLREMLFEQGTQIYEILNNFGADKITKLLGIGANVVPEDYESYGLTNNSATCVNGIYTSLDGTLEFILRVFANTTTAIDISAFNALVDYSNDRDEADLLYAALQATRTTREAINDAFVESELTQGSAIDKFTAILAYSDILESEQELFDENQYAALKADETLLFANLIALMETVGGSEKYSNINSVADIVVMDGVSRSKLREELLQIKAGLEVSRDGIKTAFEIICFGMFLKLIKTDA
ncbi:MAG: hypothetical protein LBE09_03990 [Christensenellaceae bacterium]|jgi:hypothetical protein|nr:hypothetical protein [Christensenellaceae bacterium]